MLRPTLASVFAVAACNSPQFEAWQEGQAKFASTGEAASTGAAEATTGSPGNDATSGELETDTGSGGDADVTGATHESTDTGAATDTDSATPPVGEADKPSIVSVEFPEKLYAAGPVPFTVHTERASSVRLEQGGLVVAELTPEGEGLFVGELAVRGAIDDGSHDVVVIAASGPHEVAVSVSYEVKTPKPGTMAWFKAGPAGSRNGRVARTPEGDLLEGGLVVVNQVERPNLRKRSGLTGAELWTATLDTREGSVADLATLPDGRVWVAMNVRKPGDPSPQPRIALFEAEGAFTGIEAYGDVGQEVRGIAASPDGGCFAVGFAPAEDDLDIGVWRVDGEGVQTLGNPWDYVPNGALKHSFFDFATDVVVTGDVAWVVGASHGNHVEDPLETRGMLVPMDLHTGEVLSPVIVAPESGAYTQSMFFGAAHHPEGLLVTGYGCDATCTNYRIETSLYGENGERPWFAWELAGAGARYGRDVASDSQGRAIVGGSAPESGALRGFVFAYSVNADAALPLFEHWLPASSKPSEVLGVLANEYDRLFVVGFITVTGETQSRTTLISG